MALISVLGLLGTVSLLFLNRVDLVKQQITESNIEAAREFDFYFINLKARIVADSNLLQASNDYRQYLLKIASLNPSVIDILVLDAEGSILEQYHASGRPDVDTYDQRWLSDQEMEPGAIIVNDYSYVQQIPTVEMATPLIDDIGLRSGALVVRVDLTELWNKTLNIKVGDSGYAYIVSNDGHVISHRNRSFLSNSSITLTELLGKSPQTIADAGFSSHRSLEGQRVFASGEALQTMPWFTMVEQPIRESLRSLLIPGVGLLLILIFVLFLLYEVINFFHTRMVQPLRNLSAAIQTTERGKAIPAGVITTSKFKDEFSQLTTILVDTSRENADLYQSLEHKVDIRTQELQQEIQERKRTEVQLKAAKQAADDASRAKSDFLASMSHELRTPLNGILGYAQILQRSEPLSERGKQGVSVIRQCGDHLLNLINEVLDLAKIEARKLELHPNEVHFPALLEGVAEMIRVRADQKGINFSCCLESSLPIGVVVDEKRLQQVLINLLGNAIKFTETGGVTLRVISQPLENNAPYHTVRFEVQDTGVGISEAGLAKIFQPFEQVGTVKKQSEGTGLGLAISLKIVSLMDSEIKVESQLGEGSTFWFELTLPESNNWTVVNPTAGQQGSLTGFVGERRKILIVDDRWENRSVVVSVLEPLGFEVIEASNGQEGLAKAEETQPDLIITDLMMPEMDGYELLRQVRQHPQLKYVPAIAASASVLERNQNNGLEAGANDFLAKPIDISELCQLIEKHLQLEWVYDQLLQDADSHESYRDGNSVGAANGLVSHRPVSDMVIPPQQTLVELYELALQGRLMLLQKQLKTLAASEQAFEVFSQRTGQYAENFQIDEMKIFLEHLLEKAGQSVT